ncbi:LOW QUALITY PROTEIN: hypothetical protein JCM19045_4059 [Bacillus sp. JCM 19045]|nr:LOW QUALITY PROTEIN: hypothetical protein JCM19045_4059 [Bacillus sp. JCM 19045]
MKLDSIRTKVWLGIAFTALAVLALASVLIFFLYERLYVEEQVDRFMQEGEALSNLYELEGTNETFFERIDWSKQTTEALYLVTEDPMELAGGAPFEGTIGEELITFEERQVLLQGETVFIRREHPRFQQDMIGIAIPLMESERLAGAVFISKPLADVYDVFTNLRWFLARALALAAGIIVFLGIRLTRHLVDPLVRMNAVAKRMEQGQFSERLSVRRRKDEMAELSNSLNQLASTLQQVETNRRIFLATIAHELRTPLSYIVGYIEGIEEGVIKPEQGMTIIEKEARRMNRLVNDLLDLAQLEGDEYPLQHDVGVFAELVREACETVQMRAKQKQMTIRLDLDEECIIYADRDRMKQVIINLLTNAISYSNRGKKIDVNLITVDKQAQLTIRDEGIGIPQADMPYITDRFFRVKRARSRKDGGTGLGLAIVQEIMAKHEGSLEIKSVEGQGTTATVTIAQYE